MVAAVRLRELQEERPAEVELEWRSFLLRPGRPDSPRSLDDFRRYTESWRRCAEEEPAAGFVTWRSEEGPPSHSMPSHLVAKAAATLGTDAFEAVHDRLLNAYFRESRDISSDDVLREIWSDAGLPVADFERRERPQLRREVVFEHREAIDQGASGAPAVRAGDSYGVLTGAHPKAVYEQWLARLQAAAP